MGIQEGKVIGPKEVTGCCARSSAGIMTRSSVVVFYTASVLLVRVFRVVVQRAKGVNKTR